jgi:hypothetical protein
VNPCACELTQWGFWGAHTERSYDSNASNYDDFGSVMLWVAGVPLTSPSVLPTTGTATYTGHAIADISLGSRYNTYLAAGAFMNVVNFGARSGTVEITGLDAANYIGTVSLTSGSARFSGTLAGTTDGRLATLNGSFFQGGKSNSTPAYGEMGGSITLSGPNYIGSGIFAARKP